MDLRIQYRHLVAVLLVIALSGCVQAEETEENVEWQEIQSWSEAQPADAELSSYSGSDGGTHEPCMLEGDLRPTEVGGENWTMSVKLLPDSWPRQVSIIPEQPGVAPRHGAVGLVVKDRGEGSCPDDRVEVAMRGTDPSGSFVWIDSRLYGLESGAIVPIGWFPGHSASYEILERNYPFSGPVTNRTSLDREPLPGPEMVEGDLTMLGNGTNHAIADHLIFESGYMYWHERYRHLDLNNSYDLDVASSGDGYFHVRINMQPGFEVEPRIWIGPDKPVEPIRFPIVNPPPSGVTHGSTIFDWPIHLESDPPWDLWFEAEGTEGMMCLHLHYERIPDGIRETADLADKACFAS